MHVDAPRALDGMRLELFSMLAVAASQGLGVALMPPMLIEQELARGDLVIACDRRCAATVPTTWSPALAEGAPRAPALRVFSQWLLQRPKPHARQRLCKK
jgi:DNA-binding transcriptional LysR family regulator